MLKAAAESASNQFEINEYCPDLNINSGYKILKSHGTDAFRILTDDQLCLLQVYTKSNIAKGQDTTATAVEGGGLGLVASQPDYLLFDEQLRIFRIKLNGQNLEIYFMSYFDLMENADLDFKLLKTQSVAHLGQDLSIGESYYLRNSNIVDISGALFKNSILNLNVKMAPEMSIIFDLNGYVIPLQLKALYINFHPTFV